MNIQLNPLKIHHQFSRIIATGFGIGYIPWAPGTWGTLLGVIVYACLFIFVAPLTRLDQLVGLGVLMILFLYGGYCCTVAGIHLRKHDHPAIVWDEMVAIWFVMLFCPNVSPDSSIIPLTSVILKNFPTFSELNKPIWGVAFLCFRFFDIIKPFPANYIDKRWHHGIGVMLDDIIAACYTLVLLWGLAFILTSTSIFS